MIKSIKISNVASFNEEVKIDKLKNINFFYGTNGSGKTTVSRIIAKPQNYISCQIEWEANPIKTIVYNEDFIREYFYEKDILNGIYTIGEGAQKVEEEIKNKKDELDKHTNNLKEINSTKDNKEKEKQNLYEIFKETCWQKGYLNLQNDFDLFFTGYKKDKEKFANKILEENSNNNSQLLDKKELKHKYDLLYGAGEQKINELPIFDNNSLNEIKEIENDNSILKLSIVGKKGVDIAKLIEKLHNHDWVKQGKGYYDNNTDEFGNYICPFCQQKTSEDFRKQLEEYFDETYQSNLVELKKFTKKYNELIGNVQQHFNSIFSHSNKYFDEIKPTINDKYEIIKGIISQNQQLLEKKQNNPSEVIEIKQFSNLIEETNKLLNEINEKIKKHNRLIENKKVEKQKLESEIWKFILEELKNDILSYEKNKSGIEKALSSISGQIQELEQNIEKIKKEISELEKQIKSVKPTVDAINKILEGFGFTGFKLKPTDDEKHYQVIRNDGSDAKKTLSEGERNFLVFLYFYHLINGVENPEENINQDKIIVIDDPVSSIDSDVLFIVSTLIKRLLEDIRKNKGSIKQAFLLTHNAYFFKEITFISSRESCYNRRNDTSYFIIRKTSNVSKIDNYETSPIKSSYQLLWDEIKRESIDCISLQNSMRRIIEFYFKFLANMDENDLIKRFDDKEDQQICKSIISWINAGSHEIIDDYNISMTNEQSKKFKDVFKKIFEVTGHISHYYMMMNKDENVNK